VVRVGTNNGSYSQVNADVEERREESLALMQATSWPGKPMQWWAYISSECEED
jgi:hypothetical protein